MKKIIIAGSLILLGMSGLNAQKKILDHTCFDSWKSVKNFGVSADGRWMAYAVNPQEGDGILTLYSVDTGKSIEIERGYNPSFTADGKWAIALIKPLYSNEREGKIKKLPDHEMPADSLAIVDLVRFATERIGNVNGYRLGKDGGEWIAWQSCDTTLVPLKSLENKENGQPLVVRHLKSGKSKVIKRVGDYCFSKDGKRLAMNIKKIPSDSVSISGVGVMFLPDTSFVLLDRDKPFYGEPVFNEQGDKLAYTASDDTVKTGTKKSSVYLADLTLPMHSPREYKLELSSSSGLELRPNQYTAPCFSFNGKRLIGGVAPVIAPDDTTKYEFETPELDIWRWDAPYTPPQEQKRLEELRKLNFPVVIDLSTGATTLVTDNPFATVEAPDRWDGDNVLILDPADRVKERQWNYYYDIDLKKLSLVDRKVSEIGTCQNEDGRLSPGGRYAVWYRDKNYYTYDMTTGETANITEKIPYPIWDDKDDHPMPAQPFEEVFWSKDDKDVLISDRFDIWVVDPKGKREPVCLTGEEGRKNNLSFRYFNTDEERRFVTPGEEILFTVFDNTSKYNGLATMKYTPKGGKPDVAMLNQYSYTQIKKAKDAPVYSWQRANFSESPDIWVSRGNDFLKARKLSDANPQMKDYRWGTARLVKWKAYDGNESEGVLYVPDDLDPTKKYPMLCVFYETGSERLYRHFEMEPSWSWVNYPFYVSRGYVIFVPDIHYTPGIPGESCYNYVCSGAEEMCRRYPWIDKDRIGIDGQSWGGYQTAYLVTRTDMFACAGSGAPVANMTSAFGGIRWESGDSRQAQYEIGQSRIGHTLWDAPELYIYNSPVFHADRVKTPLLIMHNDGDGAVPWYQGIEMFMALRRLQKPVWMLQYNGEQHNLRQRKNCKDITVRLQQFFDHYLKGDPMPRWMKEGIPMVRKGQELNY